MGTPRKQPGHGSGDRARCGATARSGAPCRRYAGHGTSHPGIGRCRFHGGSTPNHVKHAKREIARRAVVTYGLPRDVEPHVALTEELHRTAGHVAWLGDRVRELEPQQLHGPVVGGTGSIPRAEAHIWMRLYCEERDRLVDVARTCIAAGVEERRVRVTEEQGAQLAEVIRGLLCDLGISLTPEVRKIVRDRLTLVRAEGDEP